LTTGGSPDVNSHINQRRWLRSSRRLTRYDIMKTMVTFLLTWALGVAPAMAVDMFLKLGDLKGESVDASHKDEIDVLAWSWGMSQSGTTHTGGGGGAGKASFQDLNLTKYVDRTSVKLIEGVATGKHFPSAVLVVRKSGDKPVEYLKITLEDVIITSLSTGGSGGETQLTENVSLNFRKFKVEYVPVNPKTGAPETAIPFSWDISLNVAP
jgi:type VI secretion system secreted protein Hcp